MFFRSLIFILFVCLIINGQIEDKDIVLFNNISDKGDYFDKRSISYKYSLKQIIDIFEKKSGVVPTDTTRLMVLDIINAMNLKYLEKSDITLLFGFVIRNISLKENKIQDILVDLLKKIVSEDMLIKDLIKQINKKNLELLIDLIDDKYLRSEYNYAYYDLERVLSEIRYNIFFKNIENDILYHLLTNHIKQSDDFKVLVIDQINQRTPILDENSLEKLIIFINNNIDELKWDLKKIVFFIVEKLIKHKKDSISKLNGKKIIVNFSSFIKSYNIHYDPSETIDMFIVFLENLNIDKDSRESAVISVSNNGCRTSNSNNTRLFNEYKEIFIENKEYILKNIDEHNSYCVAENFLNIYLETRSLKDLDMYFQIMLKLNEPDYEMLRKQKDFLSKLVSNINYDDKKIMSLMLKYSRSIFHLNVEMINYFLDKDPNKAVDIFVSYDSKNIIPTSSFKKLFDSDFKEIAIELKREKDIRKKVIEIVKTVDIEYVYYLQEFIKVAMDILLKMDLDENLYTQLLTYLIKDKRTEAGLKIALFKKLIIIKNTDSEFHLLKYVYENNTSPTYSNTILRLFKYFHGDELVNYLLNIIKNKISHKNLDTVETAMKVLNAKNPEKALILFKQLANNPDPEISFKFGLQLIYKNSDDLEFLCENFKNKNPALFRESFTIMYEFYGNNEVLSCFNKILKEENLNPIIKKRINKQNFALNYNNLPNLSDEVKDLFKKISHLGFDILNQIKLGNSIAPVSIYNVLTMAYLGSSDQTKETLFDLINLKESEGYVFKDFSNSLYTSFESYNSIWYRDEIDPKKKFLNNLESFFGNSIFMDRLNDVDQLNDWVYEKSNGKIKKPFSDISAISMAMINVSDFKANWDKPFDPKNTSLKKFQTLDGNINEVATMYQNSKFAFDKNLIIDGLNIHAIKLDYDKVTKAYILMPEDIKDFIGFVKKINRENFEQIVITLKSKRTKTIDLYMPKFKINSTVNLEQNLGLNQMDMSLIDPSLKNIPVEILHKVNGKIDEKGTEFAAMTALMTLRSMPEEFRINKPFVFVVAYEYKGSILPLLISSIIKI